MAPSPLHFNFCNLPFSECIDLACTVKSTVTVLFTIYFHTSWNRLDSCPDTTQGSTGHYRALHQNSFLNVQQ